MTGTNYTGSPSVGNVVRHVYLSTACMHGIHQHCQAGATQYGEEKVPATCKWCAAPCICPCHQASPTMLEQRIEAIVDQALAQSEQGYTVNVATEITTLVTEMTRQAI